MTTHMQDEQVHGARLRELREAQGWDVAELARLCSLSESQVLELENGGVQRFYSARIKINAARKVAQVLNVHEAELVREPIVLPVDTQQANPALSAASTEQERKGDGLVRKQSSWVGYIILFLVGAGAVAWWFVQPRSVPSVALPEPEVLAPKLSDVAPSSSAIDTTPPPPVTAPSAPEIQTEAPKAELAAKEPVREECKFDGDMVVLEPQTANKPPDKLSLMLRTPALLCVQDSTGQVWREDLKPWLGRNFFGKAPWKLSSTALHSADVYFQGEKMSIGSDKTHSITLKEKRVDR